SRRRCRRWWSTTGRPPTRRSGARASWSRCARKTCACWAAPPEPGRLHPARMSAPPAAGTTAGADWRKADSRIGILFIVPFAIAALVFMVYPVAEAVRLAFYHYNPLNPDGASFAGLDNFRALAADPLFWQSFRQAAVWTACSIVLQTVIGVALALLLHLPLRGISIFRGLLLFPYIVPTVVIALILQWMLNPDLGIVNHVLKEAGIITDNVPWLSTPGMAMTSTIALNVWKYTPFVTICVLARLQTIPLELYDAAKVDGASAIRRFIDITLPQLSE